MELRHLKYFAAVAEELHFGKAAARLNVSQPPLSQQIQRLERELKVKLFVRNRHKVELTAAGQTLLRHARQILADADKAVEFARRADRGEIGQLRIGHTHSADLNVLPRLLSNFRTSYPSVGITLRRSNAPDLVSAVQKGDLDVGFIRLPATCNNLAVRTVCREALIVAVPTQHPLADYVRVPLWALAGEPQISFPRHNAPGYFDLLASLCQSAGFALQVAQDSDSIQTTLSLVSMGFGVSLQPECVRELARSGVAFRPLEGDLPKLEMAVIHRPDDRSEIVARLISIAEGLEEGAEKGI